MRAAVEFEDEDFNAVLVGMPPSVTAKIERLDEARESAYAALSASSSKVEHAKTALGVAERELRDLEQYAERYQLSTEKRSFDPATGAETVVTTPDPSRLEAARTRVRGAADKLDRARARHRELSDAWKAVGGIHHRVEQYLASLPKSEPVRVHDAEPTKPRKGEEIIDAVERIRSEIAALADAAKEARRAPIPASEAKRLARLQIDELARAGIPSVTQLLNRGGKIGWPSDQVHGASVGANLTRGLDGLALLAWIGKDKLVERVEAEIDAHAGDGALSADEKKFALLRIQDDTLALQRAEESLIEQAESRGVEIARRRDADPRAVLGLGDAMPPYRD